VQTRHIPVCIITTEEERLRGLETGAMGVMHKPFKTQDDLKRTLDSINALISRPRKRLLVIEPQSPRREGILQLIGNHDVEVRAAASAQEALDMLRQEPPDCVVLAPDLPNMSVNELVEEIRREASLAECPLLVYDEGDVLHGEQATVLDDSVAPIKQVRSPERLLDQTALYLHRAVAKLPTDKREMLERLHHSDDVLANKKVLVVDDDIRNIFALTSVLEQHQMIVLSAETGRQAIEMIQKTPDLDIVLMDIMMPEMDGIDTTRAVRQMPAYKTLPIVALTAKAMKGDREKCLEAGAWDYLSKPVDTEQLLSVLRSWLHL
jgi:hypothetical protein